MLLNLLQARRPRRGRRLPAAARAHRPLARRRRSKRAHTAPRGACCFRSLRDAGIVELVRRTAATPAHVRVDDGLQHDFSLTTRCRSTWSDACPGSTARAETYALDVLTLVESILENPDDRAHAPARQAQGREDRRAEGRGRRVRGAHGRAREARVPEAQPPTSSTTPSTPSPQKHPWVGAARTSAPSRSRARCSSASHPSTTTCASTASQRSEGVLLRYLSEAYKTLVQTVPEPARPSEVDDVIAYLRAALDAGRLEPARRVGAHAQPDAAPSAAAEAEAPAPARPRDLAADPKAFAARVRSRAAPAAQGARRQEVRRGGGQRLPARASGRRARSRPSSLPTGPSTRVIDITPAARRRTTPSSRRGRPCAGARQQHRRPRGRGRLDARVRGGPERARDEELPLIELRRIRKCKLFFFF